MGLLLSVLVACVGVIELISFYSNVRRNLTLRPICGDLSRVKENYVQELCDIRKGNRSDSSASVVKENGLSCNNSPVPTLRLISHEDIEIEYNKNVVDKSGPQRYLVTEKKVVERGRSPSPRHFVISEEPSGIKKSQCVSSIPEFFIQEQKNPKKSPNHPRYVLKDHEGRSGSPIPLPSQFLITQKESDALEYTDAASDYDHEEYSRSSPSPYPPLDLPLVPRNSISNDLVDDDVVSVIEVDEELYKSRSSSPNSVDNLTITVSTEETNSLQVLHNSHVEKSVLAATVIERANSKTELESRVCDVMVGTQFVQGTTSSQVNQCTSFEAIQEDYFDNLTHDEHYLNNLDGLGKQKYVKRNCSSRRTVKRVTVNNNLEEQSCSKSSESPKEESTASILAHAAEKLENESTSANAREPSEMVNKELEVKKEPEPFWVNH